MLKPPATAASLLLLAAALMLGAGRPLAAATSKPAGRTSETGENKSGAQPPAGTTKAKRVKVAGKKKRSRPGKPRSASTGPATTSGHPPSVKPTGLSPFAVEQAAVSKAFAEHWREQVADAERAARAPEQADRWNTVLFAIRDLESRSSPEVCFWRAVAYYHLGELGRARKTRQQCALDERDVNMLDREDVAASSLQPPSALPELKVAGEVEAEGQRAVKPVVNPNPYTGPSPTPPK